LRNALDESGFGNHPELIRLIAKVGKAIGEDSDFVRSDANAAVKPKSDAELFYGPKAAVNSDTTPESLEELRRWQFSATASSPWSMSPSGSILTARSRASRSS
jgi:hypothetical protein